jgi:Pleckstrin homology domain
MVDPLAMSHQTSRNTEEAEYEFDHADLEDPIDPCPDPVQIPDPRLTIYPEHPAIASKSTAQTFSCLISVEIPARRPRQYENVLTPISEAPSHSLASPGSRTMRSKSPPASVKSIPTPLPNPRHLYMPKPSAESSHAVLEDLKQRVTDWHGLDTKTFGSLKMWENLKMGVDNTIRDVEVYLFDRLLLTVKEKNSSAAKANPKKRKYALKGFIYLEHVNRVVDISAGGNFPKIQELILGEYVLNIVLDSGLTREFTLSFPDPLRLQVWKASLDGAPSPGFSGIGTSHGSQEDDESLLRSAYEEDTRSPRPIGAYRGRQMSDSGSTSSQERRSSATTYNTPSTQMTDFNPVSPRDANGKPVTQRAAIDVVLVVSVASSMHGLKLQILKDALKFIAKNLGDYDRMALIVFGGSSGPEVIAGMTRKSIPVWEKAIDALETGPRGVKTEVVEGVNLGLFSFDIG